MNDIDGGIEVVDKIFADDDTENGAIKFVKREVVVIAFDVLKLQFAENKGFLLSLAFLFDGVVFTTEQLRISGVEFNFENINDFGAVFGFLFGFLWKSFSDCNRRFKIFFVKQLHYVKNYLR